VAKKSKQYPTGSYSPQTQHRTIECYKRNRVSMIPGKLQCARACVFTGMHCNWNYLHESGSFIAHTATVMQVAAATYLLPW